MAKYIEIIGGRQGDMLSNFLRQLGFVRLASLDLDFKIRISDLQSNAKSENGFQR